MPHQCNHGREPPSWHCGTGIVPDRDITGSWRDVDEPWASLPAAPPGRARARRGNCRLFDTGRRNPARDGLSAGGSWIRTSGTAAQKPWISATFLAFGGIGVAPPQEQSGTCPNVAVEELTHRWRKMDSNFQYAVAVNLVIAPFVQPRRRAARTQAPGRGDACDLLLLSCWPRC